MGALLLLPLSLISGGQAWVINGDSLGYADLSTGYVEQGALPLATYPNDLLNHAGYLWVVSSGSDSETLQRIDTATMEVTSIGIGTGYNCWSAVELDGQHIAVSAALSDRIVIVNTASMSVETEIEGVGPNPEGMCLLGDSLWVACGGWGSDDNLVVVDMDAEAPVDTVEVAANCQSVAWDGDDELFVVCSGAYGAGEGSISVVDPTTAEETACLPVGGFPSTVAVRGDSVYAGDGWGPGVYMVDTKTHQVLHDSSDPACSGGNGMDTGGSGGLFVSDPLGGALTVYDASMQQLAEYAFNSPSAVAVSGALTGVPGGAPSAPASLTVTPCPAAAAARLTGARPEQSALVLDLAGRVVRQTATDSHGQAALDLTGLRSGVYLVRSGRASARLVVLEAY